MELPKVIPTEFRVEQLIEDKCDILYFLWKDIIPLIAKKDKIDKKSHNIKMNQYFAKRYEYYSGNLKAELDLSNYVT